MRFLVSLVIVVAALAVSGDAQILEGDRVRYVGGTLDSIPHGKVGRLDSSVKENLRFQFDGVSLTIDYDDIEAYEYTRKLKRHLGIVPGLAVRLLRKRKHSHYYRINFRDDKGTVQVVVFEVPKTMPEFLHPVLLARAPKACQVTGWGGCPAKK